MLERIDTRKIVEIALRAGEAIMEVYRQDFQVEYKHDKSPLTEADRKANDIILSGLNALEIRLPVLSEEGKQTAYEERRQWEYFWMVDPLDGTKEFIRKNDEFTVNIALIHKDRPVMGVVYAPALNDVYWAKEGEGAYKNGLSIPLEMNHHKEKKLRIVASKSHLGPETQAFIDRLSETTGAVECVSKGSSLKLCMVAEGSADIYPRLGPTMEWDTAAADAIVREAGKKVCLYDKQKGEIKEEALSYNKPELLNPWFVVRDV